MSIRVIAAIAFLAFSVVPASAPRAQEPPYEERGPGGEAIECQSHNYSLQRCPVPWRDARLVRQLSDTQCVRGMNWGLDRRGIWVDRGCSGRFVASGRGRHDRDEYAGGGWQPPSGWDQRFQIRCESHNYQYNFCGVDLGGGGRAYVERQISGTPCVEGETWGWNRAGVWVVQGCAAVFTVDRRWR